MIITQLYPSIEKNSALPNSSWLSLLIHRSVLFQMAPSSRGGRRKNTSTCLKKKASIASDGCCSSKPSSSDHSMEKEEQQQQQNYNSINSLDKTPSGFSTPKAKRSRIPDALSCPPAPKKRRLSGPRQQQNSPSSVSFFTPPDLDLFFLYALHEISLN